MKLLRAGETMESCHMLRYDLQFFAKDGEGGEKTEDATPKKLEDARKEGQVAKSQDLAVIFCHCHFCREMLFQPYRQSGYGNGR